MARFYLGRHSCGSSPGWHGTMPEAKVRSFEGSDLDVLARRVDAVQDLEALVLEVSGGDRSTSIDYEMGLVSTYDAGKDEATR